MLTLKETVEAKTASDAADKIGWQVEWKAFKLAAPLLVMISVMLLEILACGLWMDDRLSWAEGLRLLLLAAAFPFLPLLIGVGFRSVFSRWPGLVRDQKTVCLDEKGIKLTRPRHVRVWWKHVRRWFLAPIPGREGFVTLTLECGSATKPGRRYWQMVLEAPDQQQRLLSELEQLRQLGRTSAPVVDLVQPMPERSGPSMGLWPLAVAYYLFIHGSPLLAVGILPPDSKDSRSHLSPTQRAKLEQVLGPAMRRLNISSPQQVQMLFWLPGGLLTAAAIGVFVWGYKRQNYEMKEINRTYDLELEKIMRRGPAASNLIKSA
jgi:hypothetical protein